MAEYFSGTRGKVQGKREKGKGERYKVKGKRWKRGKVQGERYKVKGKRDYSKKCVKDRLIINIFVTYQRKPAPEERKICRNIQSKCNRSSGGA
jgi:hypothetical protein